VILVLTYCIQLARNAVQRHLHRLRHAVNGLAFQCRAHEKCQVEYTHFRTQILAIWKFDTGTPNKHYQLQKFLFPLSTFSSCTALGQDLGPWPPGSPSSNSAFAATAFQLLIGGKFKAFFQTPSSHLHLGLLKALIR
jgi:hypothetical protein